MSESTDRLSLPLLAAGQAQKEVAHNEALAALDLLVQPCVVAVGVDTPPADPAPGACWVVGAAPTGAWTGRAGALAGWTAGGWRFSAPREGMSVAVPGDAGFACYADGAWGLGSLRGQTLRIAGKQVVGEQRPAIAAAAGGTTIDAEARAALTAILAALRGHGLIAT